MKTTIIFATLLLAISTSAFSLGYPTAKDHEVLPMKDFPKQCAGSCAELAPLYDATDRTDGPFIGCGNYVKISPFGSDDGTIAGLMRKLTNAMGKNAITNEFNSMDGAIADVQKNQYTANASKRYSVKLLEINKCLYKTFMK